MVVIVVAFDDDDYDDLYNSTTISLSSAISASETSETVGTATSFEDPARTTAKDPDSRKFEEGGTSSRVYTEVDRGDSTSQQVDNATGWGNTTGGSSERGSAPRTSDVTSTEPERTTTTSTTTTTPTAECLRESILIRRLLNQNDQLAKALFDMWRASEDLKDVTAPTTTSSTTTTAKNPFKIDDDDFAWFETTTTTLRYERDFPNPNGHVRIFDEHLNIIL
jgi:hypothetical protein